jgi:hypothetical protein
MTTNRRSRHVSALAGAALLLLICPAMAQDGQWSPDGYRSGTYAAPRNDYQPSNNGYSSGGSGYGANGYSGSNSNNGGYAANNNGYGGGDAYAPSRGGGGGSYGYSGGSNGYGGGSGGDAYSPPRDGYGAGDAYSPSRQGGNDSYSDPGRPADGGGYGEPYAPPGQETYRDAPPPRDDRGTYNQNEIIAAGHGFFGAISQGLGKAVEYAFQSQGRPNGYILGEDAGGAFVLGLRYGEGMLYTKDAGDHKVFWQGPSVGYDAGAEGSKTMVLVYNLHDPSEIYNRFGGVQGAAYFVGGLSVQFQTYGHVTLAVIRSGVGVRLGANVGYLKYTRSPTWNPL